MPGNSLRETAEDNDCSLTLPDAESFTCALPIRASWQAPRSARWHPGVPGIHGAGGISLRRRCAISAELRDIRDLETSSAPAVRTRRIQGISVVVILLRHVSREYRWRRTLLAGANQSTNCAPPWRTRPRSATIPDKADCGCKHRGRK